MAVLNGRLDALAVPGFPGYEPPFGTKKPDGQPISSREENENIMLAFKKQRPIDVTENSSVDSIESNLVFDMRVAGTTLTLGSLAFRGCRVKVLNSTNGGVQVVASTQSQMIQAGKFFEFEFTAEGWIPVTSGSGTGNIALAVYAKKTPFLAATSNKRRLVIKAGTKIDFETANGVKTFYAETDTELDVVALLDTGNLAAGKDYYIYLCPDPSSNVIVRISLNKVAPLGFTAVDVKRIGGFHTLCVAVGTGLTYVEGGATKTHPLVGFVAGDILPMSVWCLNHRPYSEPEGMVYIPPSDVWVDIYLQSGSGANTKSVYQGAITRTRQYVDHVEDMICVCKELLDDSEFAAAMMGSNETTAVSGASDAGATSGGAGGRVDTANRRMISIYGVEEGCGSVWQWLRTTSTAGYSGVMHGDTGSGTQGAITVSTSSCGPYPQAGGKGSIWGLCLALVAGGNWSNGSGCGSRSRYAYNARSSAYAIIGGRGRSRPMRFVEQ